MFEIIHLHPSLRASSPLSAPLPLSPRLFPSLRASSPLSAPLPLSPRLFPSLRASSPLSAPLPLSPRLFPSLRASSPLSACRVLDENRLTGSLPDAFSALTNLEAFYAVGNQLDGTIPDSYSSLQKLRYIWLEGTIPDSYSSLQKLQYIYPAAPLSPCLLHPPTPTSHPANATLMPIWPIPQIANASSHFVLLCIVCIPLLLCSDLSFNTKITGALPDFLSGIQSLESIAFEECDFTGSLPVGYAKLPALAELYLDRNNLEGSIPGLYGDMPNLATLYLSSNRLSGEIPGSFCRLGKAKTIVLARNELRGSIPDCIISNLKELRLLDVSDNYLTGPVPSVPAGGPLQFDFSSNCLASSEGAQRNPCPSSPVAPTQPPPDEAAPRQPGGTEPTPAETTVDPSASSSLPSPDAVALMEMLAGLRAAAGTDVLPSWTQESDPCDGSWATSIKCDNRTRQVVHLDLRRADLVGDVPCFGLSQLNALTYL
ncbi:unnamed protein product [Closterium sp. NIES-54]